MTRHADAEELARFREGDLGRWRSWRVRSHLKGCARCRELDSELAEIPALLASVSEPPIPEHVTAMIQGALAHEATLRATAEAEGSESAASAPASAAPATTGPEATGADGRGAGRRRERNWRLPQLPAAGWPFALRAAAAAAAVVVLAAGGLEIAQHSGGSSSPSTASGGSRGQPAAAPFSNARNIRNGPALSYTHAGQPARITAISTNTDFTHGKLTSQVSQLVKSRSSASAQGAPANTSPGPAAGTNGATGTFGNFSVANLDGCLNRIAAGNLVIIVDVTRYQGSPATVIVTEVSAPGPMQVWVVGTGCTASGSDTLAHTQLASGS